MVSPRPELRLVPPSAIGAEAGPLGLDEAFRRYSPYVATVCLRILGRGSEVEDLVQDVFLAAQRGLGNLRSPEAVKGWLVTVAVRQARKRLRARRVWALFGLDEVPEYAELADPAASPQDRALLAAIYRVLDGLPAAQRIAWTLRYVDGERLEEVASACGCSLATAKRWISSVQATLREALADE